jgi:hypothetical protein
LINVSGRGFVCSTPSGSCLLVLFSVGREDADPTAIQIGTPPGFPLRDGADCSGYSSRGGKAGAVFELPSSYGGCVLETPKAVSPLRFATALHKSADT